MKDLFLWEHRVIYSDDVYQLVEAEVDANDNILCSSEPCLNSETLEGLQLLVDRLQTALNKYKESNHV